MQQSPNWEFAIAYLAAFCTDLPRACEVEVGKVIIINQCIEVLKTCVAKTPCPTNAHEVFEQVAVFFLAWQPQSNQVLLMLQAALEYMSVRYKLNPFKTMHEIQAQNQIII